MKSSKYKVKVVWTNGDSEEFDAVNYELHESLLLLTRQVENQTSSFLASLTSEEKLGLPLINMRYYTIQG